MATIGVYTSVCEEDKDWIPQYLKEVERLGFPFAIHLDRCSVDTKHLFTSHPLCIGATFNKKDEFSEQHKQGVFNIIASKCTWALAWDVDETWEVDAPRKFADLPDADYMDAVWVNLWDDEDHIRVDGPFSRGHRIKLYNVEKYQWKFDHPITNGAKHVHPGEEPRLAKMDLTCIHWGMMTKAMRKFHKDRWDRIYTSHVGANPYGFWSYALDPQYEPNVVPYDHRTYRPS